MPRCSRHSASKHCWSGLLPMSIRIPRRCQHDSHGRGKSHTSPGDDMALPHNRRNGAPEGRMALAENLLIRVRRLDPGCFALVMATGIVSVDASQHGLPRVALALFAFNLLAYVWLLALSLLRLARFRHEMVTDFTDPSRGAGFLTLAAATCVLGSQCVLVWPLPALATVLAVAGALLWIALIYLFFAATITARFKPGFTRSINGGWLVAVVSTQALSALVTLVAASRADPDRLQFVALSLYMLGAALYLLIITLVVYRMV